MASLLQEDRAHRMAHTLGVPYGVALSWVRDHPEPPLVRRSKLPPSLEIPLETPVVGIPTTARAA